MVVGTRTFCVGRCASCRPNAANASIPSVLGCTLRAHADELDRSVNRVKVALDELRVLAESSDAGGRDVPKHRLARHRDEPAIGR